MLGVEPDLERAHRRLSVVWSSHPLRRYFDAGLLVTLNSDDPAFFGSEVANEYLLAYTDTGFTRDELRQLAANSFRASFLPHATQHSWLAKLREQMKHSNHFGNASNESCSATTLTGDASKESWAMII